MYAFTNGEINRTALTTSELTAATLASTGLFLSSSDGLFFTEEAKFSSAFAQLFTAERCIQIHKFEANDDVDDSLLDLSLLTPEDVRLSDEDDEISHSFAKLGPNIRTPSKIRKLAVAAEAVNRTVGMMLCNMEPSSIADSFSSNVEVGNASLGSPPVPLADTDTEEAVLELEFPRSPASFMKNSSIMSKARSTT